MKRNGIICKDLVLHIEELKIERGHRMCVTTLSTVVDSPMVGDLYNLGARIKHND